MRSPFGNASEDTVALSQKQILTGTIKDNENVGLGKKMNRYLLMHPCKMGRASGLDV